MAKNGWASHPPANFSIVTGFFPEASPKETWATNPRPMLVCGTAQDPETKMVFCRVAYGTTQKLDKAHNDDLVIGNMSMLNELGLKRPTNFVLHSGEHMAILPWIPEIFRPWTGYKTPVLGILPQKVQRHIAHTLGSLENLPQF